MSEGSFEARKIGMRQNKEGVIISFVVQPDDYSAALAMVPIGARLMIGWAQIGDDEKRIENDEENIADDAPKPAMVEAAKLHKELVNEQRVAKARRQFADLPLSQQCAMVCAEPEFVKFLTQNYSRRMMELQYDVAMFVRDYCGVATRGDIKAETVAAANWDILAKKYETHKTSLKYAESIRR